MQLNVTFKQLCSTFVAIHLIAVPLSIVGVLHLKCQVALRVLAATVDETGGIDPVLAGVMPKSMSGRRKNSVD